MDEPQPTTAELVAAETSWFHIFRSMISSGDIARMGSHAPNVYVIVKAHTNFSTGRAFPSIETISEESGISIAQVKRELKVLEAHGYLTKRKVGRHNEYRLREKVSINDGDGRPSAVATWDYLPSTVKAAVADLKNVLVTGVAADAKVVHIERLQINVTHMAEGGVVINAQQLLSDMENLPPALREKLRNAFKRSRSKG